MAASARLSPAASLLRHSRIFALPTPLTPPPSQPSSEPISKSDTATLPYPTHAAIETPLWSLNKGDWGLKRPLPLKSTTKTGTPTIRVQRGIDTIEHITDFESAADHVLTLQKWQELNLAISYPQVAVRGSEAPSKGVFETPRADGTIDVASSANNRWRYGGPWLAGMTGMEFEAYVKGAVRRRREVFRERVEAHMVAERIEAKRRRAMEDGMDVGDTRKLSRVTEKDLSNYVRSLRSRPRVFGRLIAEFLDLPDGPDAQSGMAQESWEYGRSTSATRVYKDVGPPKTHPSAGLSYLRTNAHSHNHPILGPLATGMPVPARVLKIKARAGQTDAEIGVAGFVVNNVELSGATSSQGHEMFRPKSGGHKKMVRPVSASISGEGTLNLNVKTAAGDPAEVFAEEPPPMEKEEPLPAATKGSGDRMPYLDYEEKPRFARTREPNPPAPNAAGSTAELMSQLTSLGKR